MRPRTNAGPSASMPASPYPVALQPIETMEPQLHYPAVQPTDPGHAVQSPTIGDQLTQQRQQISQKKTMVREITKHNKDRCASTIT